MQQELLVVGVRVHIEDLHFLLLCIGLKVKLGKYLLTEPQTARVTIGTKVECESHRCLHSEECKIDLYLLFLSITAFRFLGWFVKEVPLLFEHILYRLHFYLFIIN